MSVLRPRDIQTRIRAGETPEDVARAAETTVDKIMGFATPVLAERAYQAELAQRASVRRRAAAGHVGNLGDAVTAHLETLEVDPASVEWDAWRREDGRWTVLAAYVAHGEHHQAAFSYDAAGRFVVADDDEARALVGERTPAAAEAPAHEPVSPAQVRPIDDLLAPREPEDDGGQLPLGDDAISLVTGLRPVPVETPVEEPAVDPEAPAAAAVEPPSPLEPLHDPDVVELQGEATIDLTDTSAAVRGAGPASTADADWIATQASERPSTSPAPAPQPGDAPESQPWDRSDRGDSVEADAREEEEEDEHAADALFEVPDAQQRPARSSRARGRASVPSWDEIMFGSSKSD